MENDLFLEMLEVYINSILYLREVYPAAIFRRRRVYNTAAYISIFPTLNNYLFNALKTAQELKASDKLFEVELIIFQREFELFGTPEDEEIMEKYVFRVEQNENADSNSSNSIEPDLHVLQFEEELRSGLIRLEQMAKNLPRLNSECCGFRIHLETTEHAYVDIVTKDNSKSDVSKANGHFSSLSDSSGFMVYSNLIYSVFHGFWRGKIMTKAVCRHHPGKCYMDSRRTHLVCWFSPQKNHKPILHSS